MKFLLGKKIAMSQWWNENKEAEPITLIDCANVVVVERRGKEKNGYDAISLGITKNKKRSERKDSTKIKKQAQFELIKEFPVSQPEDCKIPEGEKISVTVFSAGDKVRVTAISKGKGFQGVVKRHGFAGGPKTHGHRHVLRSGGSIGSAFPEHVQKGKKMAGHMGSSQVTLKNLKVSWIDEDKNIVAIRGSVPGRKGSWVKIVEA